MRRRTRWAGYVVLGASALWLVVVCLYSVGVDREAGRLRDALDALTARVIALEGLPRPEPCKCASGGFQGPEGAAEGAESAIPPRVEGTGVSGRYRYADFRFPDGSRRRYYLRRDADARQVAAWLRNIGLDAAEHQSAAAVALPSVDEATP